MNILNCIRGLPVTFTKKSVGQNIVELEGITKGKIARIDSNNIIVVDVFLPNEVYSKAFVFLAEDLNPIKENTKGR